MKILEKNVRKCEFSDGRKTTVLELIYTHRSKEKKRILVKDYDDEHYEKILKLVRKEVRNNHNLKNICQQ